MPTNHKRYTVAALLLTSLSSPVAAERISLEGTVQSLPDFVTGIGVGDPLSTEIDFQLLREDGVNATLIGRDPQVRLSLPSSDISVEFDSSLSIVVFFPSTPFQSVASTGSSSGVSVLLGDLHLQGVSFSISEVSLLDVSDLAGTFSRAINSADVDGVSLSVRVSETLDIAAQRGDIVFDVTRIASTSIPEPSACLLMLVLTVLAANRAPHTAPRCLFL